MLEYYHRDDYEILFHSFEIGGLQLGVTMKAAAFPHCPLQQERR